WPTASDRPIPLWAANRGPGSTVLDLDLSTFFPSGCLSMRVCRIPGTKVPLPCGWRIYFDTGRYSAPVNQSIMSKFNIAWSGNIVMVKLRVREDYLAHVTAKEDHLADVILCL
ncbi:hypothetical protein C8R43DRAFT_885156, partial [Mycena crocata]